MLTTSRLNDLPTLLSGQLTCNDLGFGSRDSTITPDFIVYNMP